MQMGPHKKYCWSKSYGYVSSEFSNSDQSCSSSCTPPDSEDAMPGGEGSEHEGSEHEGAEHEGIVYNTDDGLHVLARRGEMRSWGSTSPCVAVEARHIHIDPARTHDFKPVSHLILARNAFYFCKHTFDLSNTHLLFLNTHLMFSKHTFDFSKHTFAFS